ncbi:hypothetical protein [Sphingobacterium sp.]|uniref:hypothetical protein n=1 Tax=Sphingobacterium sp. TaxID=341027 RepID=UPI0028A59594|nr:hypothetical protein [Sphingobacterium sp.]
MALYLVVNRINPIAVLLRDGFLCVDDVASKGQKKSAYQLSKRLVDLFCGGVLHLYLYNLDIGK